MYLPLFLSDVSRNGSPLTSPGCKWTRSLLPNVGAFLVSSPLAFLIECIISCIGRQIAEWRIDWLFCMFLSQVCSFVLMFAVNPYMFWKMLLSLFADEEQGPGGTTGRPDERRQGAPSVQTWLVKVSVIVYFYFGGRIWELLQRRRPRRTQSDIPEVEMTEIPHPPLSTDSD
eukprot:TRINITY_DN62910_c0_g1_i1.p1 TRINITY_DN62910_c0_g1~~TRINITY_DN62910_c0_g1_i1.p1  ORF type:complete len:199 (-),score=9.15 TRINITY_DN62910_c0_g1_i1:77-592(-)